MPRIVEYIVKPSATLGFWLVIDKKMQFTLRFQQGNFAQMHTVYTVKPMIPERVSDKVMRIKAYLKKKYPKLVENDTPPAKTTYIMNVPVPQTMVDFSGMFSWNKTAFVIGAMQQMMDQFEQTGQVDNRQNIELLAYMRKYYITRFKLNRRDLMTLLLCVNLEHVSIEDRTSFRKIETELLDAQQRGVVTDETCSSLLMRLKGFGPAEYDALYYLLEKTQDLNNEDTGWK